MIPNEDPDFSIFDALILQNRSFAVYRNPGDTTIHFIMQQDKKPRQLQHLTELNTKEGFVIAPFAASEKTPVVLIHPDIVLEGEEVILDYLNKQTDVIPSRDDIRTESATDVIPSRDDIRLLIQIIQNGILSLQNNIGMDQHHRRLFRCCKRRNHKTLFGIQLIKML